jgi:hypothetical protein
MIEPFSLVIPDEPKARAGTQSKEDPARFFPSLKRRMLDTGWRRPEPVERISFGVRENTRTRQKPHALRAFDRESRPPPWHNVDNEMRMLPVLELRSAHVERLAADLAHVNVLRTDLEFAARIAHRRTAVATATGLMKQQRTVNAFELFDEVERRFSA